MTSIIYCRVSPIRRDSHGQTCYYAAHDLKGAVAKATHAVIITRHRVRSERVAANGGDDDQDVDTAPEPPPAEPTAPSTAALRSVGGDDFGVVHEAVDHGGGDAAGQSVGE